jgi:hypothetical protein
VSDDPALPITEATAECENCGRLSADGLAVVHRMYLIPEEIRVEETERWCVSCRTQYPHEDA